MPRTRPPYPKESRGQIVALARAGRSLSELAQEFEPSDQTIRTWIKQGGRDEGHRADGLTTTERAELRWLRKEYERLVETSKATVQLASLQVALNRL